MQRIALDMDEVMADTLEHQLAWLRREHGVSLDRSSLHGKKPRALLAPKHHESLESHMHLGSFFRDIPPMRGARETVERLCERYEVFITTAAMDYPRSCDAKFDWLGEHFDFVGKDRFVFCGDKSIVRADFLIDDNPRQLERFAGVPILYEAPHNVAEQRFERVAHWADIAHRFLA